MNLTGGTYKMEIIVKSFTPEGRPYGELLTSNLDDAVAHFTAEVRLGHKAIIEATPTNY